MAFAEAVGCILDVGLHKRAYARGQDRHLVGPQAILFRPSELQIRQRMALRSSDSNEPSYLQRCQERRAVAASTIAAVQHVQPAVVEHGRPAVVAHCSAKRSGMQLFSGARVGVVQAQSGSDTSAPDTSKMGIANMTTRIMMMTCAQGCEHPARHTQ